MQSLSPLATLSTKGRVMLLVVGLTVVKLWLAGQLDLAEDEAYYRLWGLHLSWGYYDHPPLVALWIAAGQRLFGDNNFGLRFLTVLTPVLGSWLLWLTAQTLYPATTIGLRAVVWLNVTVMVGVGGLIVTPDAPSVLLWGLAVLALAKVHVSSQGWWWLLVGAAIGLGADAKYTNLFLGPGVLLWLVVTPSARRWLLTPWPWLGGLLGLAMIAPVLGWNAAHGFPTLHKQFGRVVQSHPLSLQYIGELITGQIGLLTPLIALFAGLAVLRWRRLGPNAGVLLWTSLPFVAYLVMHALRDRVQANWPAPLYPSLVLLAAIAAESLPLSAGWSRARATTTPLALGLVVLILAHGAIPASDWVGSGDPVARLRGWQKAGDEVTARARAAGVAWVAVHGDTVMAEVAATVPASLPVEAINERFRYFYRPTPARQWLDKPALVVVRQDRDRPDLLPPCFATLTPLDPITVVDGRGHVLMRWNIYRASGGRPDLFETGCD